MRMVELFTTGPARVLGMERKIAAGQPADLTIFSTEHAVDIQRERFAQQIAQFAVRWPELQGRADGYDCGRKHRAGKDNLRPQKSFSDN